jgi:hypothetical protein
MRDLEATEQRRQEIIEQAVSAADKLIIKNAVDADEVNLLTVRFAHKFMEKVLIAANMADMKRDFTENRISLVPEPESKEA